MSLGAADTSVCATVGEKIEGKTARLEGDFRGGSGAWFGFEIGVVALEAEHSGGYALGK
jgi:hypothetical protein